MFDVIFRRKNARRTLWKNVSSNTKKLPKKKRSNSVTHLLSAMEKGQVNLVWHFIWENIFVVMILMTFWYNVYQGLRQASKFASLIFGHSQFLLQPQVPQKICFLPESFRFSKYSWCTLCILKLRRILESLVINLIFWQQHAVLGEAFTPPPKKGKQGFRVRLGGHALWRGRALWRGCALSRAGVRFRGRALFAIPVFADIYMALTIILVVCCCHETGLKPVLFLLL